MQRTEVNKIDDFSSSPPSLSFSARVECFKKRYCCVAIGIPFIPQKYRVSDYGRLKIRHYWFSPAGLQSHMHGLLILQAVHNPMRENFFFTIVSGY